MYPVSAESPMIGVRRGWSRAIRRVDSPAFLRALRRQKEADSG